MMTAYSTLNKKSKIILFCTICKTLSGTDAFSSFKTDIRSSQRNVNLKMGLFENMPTIIDNDASSTFGALSHLILDVGTKVIDPGRVGSLQLLESIGQVFGLISYCTSNECIRFDELTYQAVKMTFSIFILLKTTIPTIEASLNLAINPVNCPLSSRDKQAYEDLFEPIGLSWLHYNTLKYYGAFEWITLKSNEIITLPNSKQSTSTGSKLKDLTKRALEKDIYWLYQGSTNDENNNIIFASNILQSTNNNSVNERKIIAGHNGATILKINSHKILKLLENDAKLESCMQSLIFIGACQELNQPSNANSLI